MRKLRHDDYLKLRENAEIIEADEFGDKVLLLPDGTYLKLFRRKRLLSSAAWYPYAQRFADNAAALAALEVPAPRVIALFRLPTIARDAVHYHPLAGRTVRQIIADGMPEAEAEALRVALRRFIGVLHEKGIYFRSAHLGNIIRTPAGEFGLIDISDLTVGRRPLWPSKRRRNLQHILRYADDRAWLQQSPCWQGGTVR